MKIAVSGGGTGGHTLPALAVINELKEYQDKPEIFFIGSRFGMESRIIPKMGIKYYGVSCGKFRRYHASTILNIIDPTTIIKNTLDLFRFIRGIFEARSVLSHEKPDVLFAKGGYVSLPVGLAAKNLGIPIVIHESDIVMGLANKKLATLSDKVCVSFPTDNYKEIEAEKIIETGNPLRKDILKGRGAEFLAEIGFSKNKKTILFMGGSQGSKIINETVLEIITELLCEYQVLWIVGDRDFSLVEYQVSQIDDKLKKNIKIYGFVSSEMSDLYSVTDYYVGRSGSNVIFELGALGIPAIFIPLKSSAGGHQHENARVISRSGAAYIIDEGTLTGNKLLKHISIVLSREGELELQRKAMREWGNTKAAENIAEIVYSVGREYLEQIRASQNEEN